MSAERIAKLEHDRAALIEALTVAIAQLRETASYMPSGLGVDMIRAAADSYEQTLASVNTEETKGVVCPVCKKTVLCAYGAECWYAKGGK